MRKVTWEELEKMKACEDQLKLFSKVFPRGVEITRENLHKAVDAGLNVFWYVHKKFGRPFEREATPLREERTRRFMIEVSRHQRAAKGVEAAFEKAREPVWQALCKADPGMHADAVKAYEEAMMPLRKKLKEEEAPFIEEHKSIVDSIHKEYNDQLVELILEFQGGSGA